MKRYIAIAIALTAVSCSNSNSGTSGGGADSAQVAHVATQDMPKLADSVDQKIYNHYIHLKDALVASDKEAAAGAAADLKAALGDKSGCESTAVIAENIAAAPEIKVQRAKFTALSNDLIALFKHADMNEGEIFVQHCPMANSGEGGDWLASEKNIRNPYYGDEMMECGSVVEEISAR